MVLNWTLLLLALCITHPASAFVLLAAPEKAKLVPEDGSQTIKFLLSPTPPLIKDKDSFAGGYFSNQSETEFWLSLVELAMDRWNKVPGIALKLEVELADQARLDSEDRLHSIVVAATNLSSSAYASPQTEGAVIYDCDIAVSERGAYAAELAYTLLHELGHCLGLGHNHADYRAVMGYSRLDRSLVLGLDDEAGALYLYPSGPDELPKELVSCGTVGQSQPMSAMFFGLPLGLALLSSLLTRRRD